jgi:hypothetical protein
MYIKIRIEKHLYDSFRIQNGLKQGDALSPLHFKFDLEYAITKVEEKKVGLKVNGTHQMMIKLSSFKESSQTFFFFTIGGFKIWIITVVTYWKIIFAY